MNIYEKKSRWKLYLTFGAVAIVVTSLLYTNNLASQLAEQECQRAKLSAEAILEIQRGFEDTVCGDANIRFISSIIIDNKTIPFILTDEDGTILHHNNLNTKKANDSTYLLQQKTLMAATNDSLLIQTENYTNYVFYKNSNLYTALTYFPYFQLLLIFAFLMVSYYAFSEARRAEQNQVWIGLAKETAHQLGTPITAIVGWIEHLKGLAEGDEYQQEILQEFRKDIGRLEVIAERFSKVGAKPELYPTDIVEVVKTNMNYMSRRAPKKVRFELLKQSEEAIFFAPLNPPLFDWVLENLIRNALDAMGGTGKLIITISEDNHWVYVDVKDTGKGIPSAKFKTIFKPGYSTKQRGWGLGLSLTRRIVSNYHNGKVFVKESEIGKGTTFRIQLQKKQRT